MVAKLTLNHILPQFHIFILQGFSETIDAGNGGFRRRRCRKVVRCIGCGWLITKFAIRLVVVLSTVGGIRLLRLSNSLSAWALLVCACSKRRCKSCGCAAFAASRNALTFGLHWPRLGNSARWFGELFHCRCSPPPTGYSGFLCFD